MADKDSPAAADQADSKGTGKKGTETVSKFANHGTAYRAKLIGFEDVPEPRGDEMCQKALAGLKQAVLSAKEHKQKIAFKMTLECLEIVDLTTSEVLHKHPINKVSFIAKDATDNRAFGYVVGKADGKFQFFGIKTEKAAEQVVLSLRDLFTEVFNLKKQAKEAEQAAAPSSSADATPAAAAKADATDSASAFPSASVPGAQPASGPAGLPGTAPAVVPVAAVGAAPAVQAEPKKSTIDSLIDLDIDWGIGSSAQPASNANAAATFPNSAWGAPTSPMSQMGLGMASPLSQMGFGGQPPAQNDPFVVAPAVARQLGSQPPQQQQQQQQQQMPALSASYATPGFGVPAQQQQQQQMASFGQQQPPIFQQQQQPSLFGPQQPYGQSPFSQQQTAFGQQSSPMAAYGQQQQPAAGFAVGQPQINPATGQMQWPQSGPNPLAPGLFGAPAAPAAAAGSAQFTQQSFFSQGGQPAAVSAQPAAQLQGQFNMAPAQFGVQQQQPQLFYQQPQQQQQQQQPGVTSIFGSQPGAGATQVNPFSQQQQQPVNNPFGANPGAIPGQAGSAQPRPAPRGNSQPQLAGGWPTAGGSAPVPTPRSGFDAFADLDVLKSSNPGTAQAPPAGNASNGGFW